ncbi:Uu.00g120400.m01.CDS01 [Anthostomella pinea]|uniref:Uu.00g120400.m01.CDS01 n=1 Tax=Anthostomella pinea TaxID=933095 RepID=A0AAI8VHH4_9PEZI|nr:Uu.00g120400.m01.CDS01 [Anthostomella pinea]
MSPTNSSTDGKSGGDLERQHTISPRDQPALPYIPRDFASPMPLGLLSFATSVFMLSLFELQPRGITVNNIVIANMIFYGGIGQVVSGIMEFVTGNTFGATVFSSFGGFNLAYAFIFLPGSGIIAAYTDAETGLPTPEFSQAVAMFVWGWFILSTIFTFAAARSSWALLLLLFFVDLTFLLIATGHMMSDGAQVLKASAGTGFVAAAIGYYTGAAGLMNNGVTPFNLPLGSLARKHD